MALNASFNLLRVPQCGSSRKYFGFLKSKRLYARGSRYFPTDRLPADGEHEHKLQNNESNVRHRFPTERDSNTFIESPRQLLENAASFKERIPASTTKEQMEDIWNSDPYPKNSNWKQSQAKHSKRPACDPRDTSILLFPGQGNICPLNFQTFYVMRFPICKGTQFVGMGKELLQYPLVKQMFDLASSVLGYNLLSLCLDGPKQTLNQTVFCQPALVSNLLI